MADTIFTRALTQAVAIQGTSQGLASALRVPEGTLLRWLSGRAQMPLAAFHEVIRLLVEHEERLGRPTGPAEDGVKSTVKFALGNEHAQCPQCRGEEFVAPTAPLRMTSVLSCRFCQLHVVHADLLKNLATDVVKRTRGGRARQPGARAPLRIVPRADKAA